MIHSTFIGQIAPIQAGHVDINAAFIQKYQVLRLEASNTRDPALSSLLDIGDDLALWHEEISFCRYSPLSTESAVQFHHRHSDAELQESHGL